MKNTTLVESQFEAFFKSNDHPSVEKRLQKAEEAGIEIRVIKLHYSKKGRLLKVTHYVKDGRSFTGGELDGLLKQYSQAKRNG